MADLDAIRHADDLRETWQGRVLAHTKGTAIGAIVLSVLAHSYDEAIPVLLRVMFPGFEGLSPPGLCSAARIDKTGAIVADIIARDGTKMRDAILFTSELRMQSEFRRMADEMKLSDADRREFFGAALRWIVADRRIDPTMDPNDPEAKRLVVH